MGVLMSTGVWICSEPEQDGMGATGEGCGGHWEPRRGPPLSSR